MDHAAPPLAQLLSRHAQDHPVAGSNCGKSSVRNAPVDFRHVLRGHVYGCFIDDEVGAHIAIDYMGVDNVMAEADYPHSDSSWPDSIGLMRRQLAHLPVEDQVKVLRTNAERLFQFQPAALPQTTPA